MSISETLASAVREDVTAALREDIGTGDVTASLVPQSQHASATVISRDSAVIAGQPWANEVFRQLHDDISIEWYVNDGDHVDSGAELCLIKGNARALLTGERTALNFLQMMSATATVTARYVKAVENTHCRILDTRKTLPGLRVAQKYAVRAGGGDNHRMGLFDAVLIKENHIASCGGISEAVRAARDIRDLLPIEVEVESIGELREALQAGADQLLLDNFTIELLQQAVDVNQAEGNPPADLEASGGITIDGISRIAETGVDYISVGTLTKDVSAVDLSMRFEYERT